MSDNNGITIRFQAYTGEGLALNVSLQKEDIASMTSLLAEFERMYPQMGSFRMLLREPPTGSLRAETYHVTGWMLGQTQDAKSGEMLPAVFLYGDAPHLEFSLCTVYHEMLDKLPPSIDWRNAQLVGNAAPPAVKARGMRSYNTCDITIVMLPQFDREGQPIMNKNGKPRYKFSHVIGYSAPDGDDAPEPSSTPEPPKTPSSPPPTPTGTPTGTPASPATGNKAPDAPGHRQAPSGASTGAPEGTRPRGVAPAGAQPGTVRLNTDSERCPQCFAPPGKRHGDGCTVGLDVPDGEAAKNENPFGDDPLSKYAKAFSDPDITLSQDTTALIFEMRQLDKTSARSMTITVPAKDDQPAIPGQYNFLVGLINKLGEKMGTTDREMHNKVLSFIFGALIRSDTAPGENAKVLLERLHPGTQKKGPNPNFHRGTVDSIMEIIGAIMFMDSREGEEEGAEYAA